MKNRQLPKVDCVDITKATIDYYEECLNDENLDMQKKREVLYTLNQFKEKLKNLLK